MRLPGRPKVEYRSAKHAGCLMSVAQRDWVVEGLRNPQALLALDGTQWSLLVRQARAAGLLARIAGRLDELGLIAQVPEAPRGHLRAMQHYVAAQHHEVRQEIKAIRRALASVGLPTLLLKGAAYVATDSPAQQGRAFSDVDILVPKPRLAQAESALMLNGWMTTHLSPYDQRYYRQWMHELPPMQHVRRKSVLDVHHTILPETARARPDAAKLFADAQDVPGWPGVRVLSPRDRLLHSMTHLFHNDDLSHGLRDLSDLDLLLRELGQSESAWPPLLDRAAELDLARPLYYGLHCCAAILGTPLPGGVLAQSARHAPSGITAGLMRELWDRALRCQHHTAARPGQAAALFLLYVRAHWLRMPPLMLMRHLATKAVMRTEAAAQSNG